MLRINNTLSQAGMLTLKDIDYSKTIPKLTRSLGSHAEAIWECYFDLIFRHIKLPERINKNKALICRYLPSLAEKLFADESLRIDQLLAILIEDPRNHKGEILEDHDTDTAETKTEKRRVRAAFGYNAVVKRPEFAELIRFLDINVCPYCGRMFTTTVEKKKAGIIRANQVDHYLPKSLYPYLAVSIWNWIPVCGPCNLLKSNEAEKMFLYPYSEEMGDEYRFTTHIIHDIGYLVGKDNSENDFQITIEPTTSCRTNRGKASFRERAESEINKLGLEELYSAHKSYVCDIFRQRYVFCDEYVDSLVSSFPELFNSRADVRALLYLKSINEDNLGNAPLGKLTRDIDYEIDTLLYGKDAKSYDGLLDVGEDEII